MKKSLLLVTILSISLFSTASLAANQGDQITPGTMMFGGTVFYQQRTISRDNDTNETIKTMSFAPTLGYFIVSNVAILASFNYTTAESDGSTADSDTIGIGFGAGFYIPKGVVCFYMSALFDFESTDYGNNNGYTAYGISLKAGALFMMGRNWGLDAGVKFSYLMGSTEVNDNKTDSSFNDFTIGYFGVQAFF